MAAPRPVIIIGTIMYTDNQQDPSGIWGGSNQPFPTPPIANAPGIPGYNPGDPSKPPGFWGGGNVPMPTPPIANVPGVPGYKPPIEFPPSGGIPTHPIEQPPTQNTPEGYEWKQVYSPPSSGGWEWALVEVK